MNFINYNKDQPLVFNDTTSSNINKDRYNPFTHNKDKDWYKYWCDIYCSAFTNGTQRKEEKFYRNYRGQKTDEDIKAITETFGSALPVPNMPHIPLIRRYIDHLVSVSQLRPLVFNIFTTDVDAIRENDEKLIKDIVENITKEMLSSMQKETQDPQQAQQLQLELQEKIKKQSQRLSNHKIVQERMATKCIDLVMNRLHLKDKWSVAFLDKLITGKQYYRCRLRNMGELPDFEIINPTEIAFAKEDVENLNECTFVVRKYYLSIQEIYTKYGHLFDSKDEEYMSHLTNTYSPTSNYSDEFDYDVNDEQSMGYIGSISKNLIEIHEVEWKVNKKIPVKELNDKLELLSESDGLFKDEKDIKYRYYQELHTCTRISSNVYIKYGVVEYAKRNPNNISEVMLSYNGRLYNNRNAPALSLVNELTDLQLRYDILWYKLFEIITLSGVKGATIIKELIPAGTSIDEWIYYRRLGLSQLSIGEGQDKLISQLGQIASTPFDDTLPPQAVQSLILAITQIEKTVGDICGIPPQALGQTQQYETKANTELSVAQGTITVENLHKDHFIFIRQSLEDLLHWSKISLSKGDLKDYLFTKEEQQVNNIEWNWIDYGIQISDSYKEEKNLRDVKSVVAELVKSQQITMDIFTKAQSSNSVNEIQSMIDIAVKDMKEMQQQNQKAEQEKLQGELKLKQTELQIKQEDVKQKTQLENNKLVQDKELKQQEIDIKDRLATVEEQYVSISRLEAENNLANTNKRVAGKENKNKYE